MSQFLLTQDLRHLPPRLILGVRQKNMATITWQHPPPTPDPFEALAGDRRKYSVHLCEAREHSGEELALVAGVVTPALDAALAVTRPEACCVLFDFDAVYSVLTVVTTDLEWNRDEHEVYKLCLHDWDDWLQSQDVSDSEFEKLYDEFEMRMRTLIDVCLSAPSASQKVEALLQKGFELYFSNSDSEAEWTKIK